MINFSGFWLQAAANGYIGVGMMIYPEAGAAGERLLDNSGRPCQDLKGKTRKD